MMRPFLLLLLPLASAAARPAAAFVTEPRASAARPPTSAAASGLTVPDGPPGGDVDYERPLLSRRRSVLTSLGSAAAVLALSSSPLVLYPPPSLADDAATLPEAVAALAPPPAVEMKSFLDSEGLFAINVPKRFFVLRRKAKGDLPDAKTGKGRRGSSIFTAGDMGKAEVVAVERFPTFVLLEEEGIAPVGDLRTFPSIGSPTAVAELINLRRERESNQQSTRTQLMRETVGISQDGKTLTFTLRSKIDVQKPELLLEQTGVSELYRITVAKATLEGNDGNIMAVFASALETDFLGPDGDALRGSVDSVRALGSGGGGGSV